MSPSKSPSVELQSNSIESELISKFLHQNQLLKSKLVTLKKSHQEKKKNAREFLQLSKLARETQLKKLEMYRQRQELSEQKLHEMVYLTQLLRTRATQLGIESDSDEDGSDDVFNDDEKKNEE